MITTPEPVTIPDAVMRDCAPAPVPEHVTAHAALVHRRRVAASRSLQPVPPIRPSAAPMRAQDLRPGDVIRNPAVPGGFLRVTHQEANGALFGYGIHYLTGALEGRVTPVRIPAGTVVAVWMV